MYENATESDRLLAHGSDNNIGATTRQPHLEQPDAEEHGGDEGMASGADSSSGMILKVGSTMFDFFVSGCAMAAVGALIPDIERRYHTSDGMTAFIFPAGMIGYVGATASVKPLASRFGRRGIAVASPIIRFLATLLLAMEPSFGVVLAAYVCFGLGTGMTDMAWNTWASSSHRPNVLQGLLHGSFSVGCIAGPVMVVAVLRQHSWNTFYLILGTLSIVELLVQGWAFRHDRAPPIEHPQEPSRDTAAILKRESWLRSRTIWICGAFYFIYQGVEATFTGWIVVFMLRVRHAESTVAGLASSTFWLGMAAGRYGLGIVTERYGVPRTVAIYIAVALGLQILLNLVSDISLTMALLAANGFFVAPLFPSGIVLLVSRLKAEEHLPAVAILIGLGQVGGALATLAVGFMADTLGIRHLFELMCGLSAMMLAVWTALVLLK